MRQCGRQPRPVGHDGHARRPDQGQTLYSGDHDGVQRRCVDACGLGDVGPGDGVRRRVMAVPGLAASPDGAAGFALIHADAGTAIVAHLGMGLTAGDVALIAAIDLQAGAGLRAAFGGLTALAIAGGAMEGVALAPGRDGAMLALAAIAGSLSLTVWLIWSGVALFRRGSAAATQPHRFVTAP